NNSHWTIAQKQKTGVYKVIMSLPKRNQLPKKYKPENDLLASKKPNEILWKFIQKKRVEDERKKALIKSKKMEKGTLYVAFDRSYTERISARKFNRIDEKDIVAQLVGETPSFI